MKIIVTSILLAANLFCCTQNKSTDKGTSFIGKIDKKTFLKAYEELISKNVQFLESNHKAIFGSNLSTFNSLIDSLKWTENTLVTNYQNSNENIDLIFIDSLITEKEYKHKISRNSCQLFC